MRQKLWLRLYNQPPSGNSQNLWNNVLPSLVLGTKVMAAQAPVLNGWNRVSVVACDRNLSTLGSIQQIYQGKVDKNRPP